MAEVTSEKEEEPVSLQPEREPSPVVEVPLVEANGRTRRMSKRTRSRNTNSTSSNMSELAPSLQVEQLPETIIEGEKESTKPKPRRGRPKKTPVKEAALPLSVVNFDAFDPHECLDRLDTMEREFYLQFETMTI